MFRNRDLGEAAVADEGEPRRTIIMTTNKSATDVMLDFHADFRQIIERALTENGVKPDPAESYGEAVYRYYANMRRRLNVQRYIVVEASGLVCPPQSSAGYAQLKAELEQGIDVNPRLSRSLSKAGFEDKLFNDWGVVHFHLGLRDAQGHVRGAEIVLFAFVRDSVVHCIGFFDHASWTRIEVLEVLQRNWPQAMEHARVKGLTGYEATDEQRARFRAAGANILNVVNGVVYGAVGGGYTAAKTSMAAHWQADRAILSIEAYEEFVREKIASIILDFKAAGFMVGTPPVFHLHILEDGRAIATEATAEASFILGAFPW